MIVSRTPYRVSLFGGGTDYPIWYEENGGAVIGFAINKYSILFLKTLPPFFSHKYRIVYSKTETVQTLDEIQHPAVRHVLQEAGISDGLEILHDGEVPAWSGLGTSSSFTVGLLNAIGAMKGETLGATALGAAAIHMEQVVIGESVGSQDQLWAAHGGLNRIDFHVGGGWTVTPLDLVRERELMDHLLLVYTGNPRIAANIARCKIINASRNAKVLRAMRGMVDRAGAILRDRDAPLADIGRMLHESWLLKRGLAEEVSTPALEAVYERAIAAGALGGKALGAGGGGFMLFFVEPNRREAVQASLSDHVIVDMDIDRTGSRVVTLGAAEI